MDAQVHDGVRMVPASLVLGGTVGAQRRVYPPGAIVVLTRGEVDDDVLSFIAMMAVPFGSRLIRIRGTQVAKNRNLAVHKAFDEIPGCGWTLFCDSDQKVRPNEYDTIIARLLDWDVPVVGAAVRERYSPCHLNAWTATDPPTRLLGEELVGREALMPVAAVGTGFLLVRKEAYQAVAEPWFALGKWEADMTG